MDNCQPATQGGNSTITNGNEQDCRDACVQIPVRTEGAQDGELH
jgi:hypothetical protein